jgi:hypothetical protein
VLVHLNGVGRAPSRQDGSGCFVEIREES